MGVEQYKNEYLDFLKEQLKAKCNSDMCCEIYWDYRDEVDPSTLREIVDDYKEKGFDNPKDYLVEKLFELNRDYDDAMFDDIEKEIRNCGNPHVVAYFEELGNLREDAYSIGYSGIDINVDDLLKQSKFRINIMFATDVERDYDMGSIVNAFGSWRKPDFEYLEKNVDDLDNALTYFIHQQGHSVKEVYACLLGNPRGFGSDVEMSFAKAVVNDIVNNSSDAVSEITALVKLNGNEFLELMEIVEKGEKYLTFETSTDIGIFNEWSGCGGLLEFKLDKPFVVPVDMVREVQIEGAKNREYSVDSVYGLVDSCWKETLGYTDEKPVLFEEDLEATVKVVQTYLNPFELKKYVREYDFIAIVQNNTDSVLKFSFDEDLGINNFEIAPQNWVGLLADEDGRETLKAIENEQFEVEFVEVKPKLDEVIKSCSDMVNMAQTIGKNENDLEI